MQFIQSSTDFPQFIKLGDKMPSFGLHRFKHGLRFVPVDDEGFTLRGDKQRLLYKGRRRSHRFTILGDTSFEYDCILKKEPDSNVIRLRIEGAEKYDFFRQPDFVRDPFLKGSYAVYKKQTLIGEGTGKLCHIHRPEIIDARGRRCWGALAVVGNELLITIPEKWLGDAKYPVVVDPTIGTNTVGAFTNIPNTFYEQLAVYFFREIVVEKFVIPNNFNSQATAYFYSNDRDGLNNLTPLIYSNNNNLPNSKLSCNEGRIIYRNPNSLNLGWLSSVFNVNNTISSGDAVWFGFYADTFYPRFDFVGSIIIISSINREIFINIPINEIDYNDLRLGLKLSMYFTYEAAGNNYNKTLVETARVNDSISKIQTFFRDCVNTARINMTLNASRIVAKICHIIDNLNVNDTLSKIQSIFRKCVVTARINMALKTSRILPKICNIIDSLYTETKLLSSRGIHIKLSDLLKADGIIKRRLSIFMKIITNTFARSYLIKRFLNSKIEITLKSRIGESNRNEQ